LSGQPTPAKEGPEYAWLTKEEIEEKLSQEGDESYRESVMDLLSE